MTRRPLATAVAAVLALALAPGQAAAAPEAQPAGGVPIQVTVKDSRTSPPDVDIASVKLHASWYWDSAHTVTVRVPGGIDAGRHLTVWFDIDGDNAPDGRYDLTTRAPKKPTGTMLRLTQTLRSGGGWGTGGTLKPPRSCGSEDDPPVFELDRGATTVVISMDVFWCFGKHPAGDEPGAWRAVVRLAHGPHSDMAPSKRRWSPKVRGWEPCDPSGGNC